MSDFRPGDRVRVFGPGLDAWDEAELIGGREGVVTIAKGVPHVEQYGVVIYDERGDVIPKYNFGWDPAEFDEDDWPMNRYHRCVWLLTDGELEPIEPRRDLFAEDFARGIAALNANNEGTEDAA